MRSNPHESSGLTLEAPSMTTCKNCGNHFAGHYCNHCGQRADTHRITWHYVWHEIPHSVWHLDKGILFTLKELFSRPGYTIREFLDGKRVNHYRPLALILILGGILTFILHGLDIHLAELGQNSLGVDVKTTGSKTLQQFQLDLNHFIERYQNLIQIALLPLTSMYTWLLFRRQRLNYPEHLVANTFLANIALVFSIVGIVIFKVVGNPNAFSVIMATMTLISAGWRCWAYAQLFRGKLRPLAAVLRAAAANLCSFLSFLLLVGLLSTTYVYFFLKKDIRNEIQQQKTATPAAFPHR